MIDILEGTKYFNSYNVFKNVTLHFESGNYYTLTGPNGSGKSTLMNCLLYQENLNEGDIFIEGSPIRDNMERYSQSVFGINDSIGWLPGITVGQHLELIYKNHKNIDNPLGIKISSVKEALELLEIPQAYDREPYMLSSGQEQRARLASLLLRPANYYFLDEPEKRLDVSGVNWIYEWVNTRISQGAMVCIATHDQTLNSIDNTKNIQFPLVNNDNSEQWG